MSLFQGIKRLGGNVIKRAKEIGGRALPQIKEFGKELLIDSVKDVPYIGEGAAALLSGKSLGTAVRKVGENIPIIGTGIRKYNELPKNARDNINRVGKNIIRSF